MIFFFSLRPTTSFLLHFTHFLLKPHPQLFSTSPFKPETPVSSRTTDPVLLIPIVLHPLLPTIQAYRELGTLILPLAPFIRIFPVLLPPQSVQTPWPQLPDLSTTRHEIFWFCLPDNQACSLAVSPVGMAQKVQTWTCLGQAYKLGMMSESPRLTYYLAHYSLPASNPYAKAYSLGLILLYLQHPKLSAFKILARYFDDSLFPSSRPSLARFSSFFINSFSPLRPLTAGDLRFFPFSSDSIAF